jgi:cyanophycinase
MKFRHLFLFGGGPPFTHELGRKFANLVTKKNKVAILFIERYGWQAYMPKYTSVLEQHGLTNFLYLPLSQTPSEASLEQLASCSGIIIGGGETELYRSYIVDTPIGKQVQKMYEEGIPVAGFSAGALICPKNCVIPPIDNAENKHLFLEGLGLIKDCVISVHFTKWNEEENLMKALSKTNVSVGYGIDDDSGLYFVNEILCSSEGNTYMYEHNKGRNIEIL